jgi:hypothetical protein
VEHGVTTPAAIAFALVAGGAVAFQVALALGAPWGAYAMGGRFSGPFPPRMRAAALGQGVIIAGLAFVELSAAELVAPAIVDSLPSLVWVPVAFSVLSLVLNLITPSPGERRIWVPVAVALALTSVSVAVSAP